MKNLIKASFFVLSSITCFNAYADCPDAAGNYGNGLGYQDIACRLMIKADRTGPETNRNITLNNEGMIQVFSNFPGRTNSDSTGARVYYIFPTRQTKSIGAANATRLSVTHSSGVTLNFDRNGRVSSPDLEMRVSPEINSQNRGGVEITNYPHGILIDIGWRLGNTPTMNPAATVTVTDKNNRKCTFPNSEFHRRVGRYDAELIYKTNESLHAFLRGRCPLLNITDLASPAAANISRLNTVRTVGEAPSNNNNPQVNDSAKKPKQPSLNLDDLLRSISQESGTER